MPDAGAWWVNVVSAITYQSTHPSAIHRVFGEYVRRMFGCNEPANARENFTNSFRWNLEMYIFRPIQNDVLAEIRIDTKTQVWTSLIYVSFPLCFSCISCIVLPLVHLANERFRAVNETGLWEHTEARFIYCNYIYYCASLRFFVVVVVSLPLKSACG